MSNQWRSGGWAEQATATLNNRRSLGRRSTSEREPNGNGGTTDILTGMMTERSATKSGTPSYLKRMVEPRLFGPPLATLVPRKASFRGTKNEEVAASQRTPPQP
eukprot:1176198-Prorocentrum_minimum.AAC.5